MVGVTQQLCVFVVLRRNSMLIDDISHTVFPGVVVGYALPSWSPSARRGSPARDF